MKVKSESEVTQSCLAPSDPMDCSLPGSSGHPSGCELVSRCGFDLRFPNDLEHLFLCFLATVLLLNRWVLSS